MVHGGDAVKPMLRAIPVAAGAGYDADTGKHKPFRPGRLIRRDDVIWRLPTAEDEAEGRYCTSYQEVVRHVYWPEELLGHADVKTTQVYAKIIDKKKEEAVNKLPKLNIAL